MSLFLFVFKMIDSEAVRKASKDFDTRLSALVGQLTSLHNGDLDSTASKSRDNSQSVIYLKVVSLLEQFVPPRLPAQIYFGRLIQSGEELIAAREYDLACNECFRRFLITPQSKRGLESDTEAARIEITALEFRASMGIIMCRFFMAVQDDSELRKSSTADEVLMQLEALRDLMEVWPDFLHCIRIVCITFTHSSEHENRRNFGPLLARL